jgi:thioredoxin reductase
MPEQTAQVFDLVVVGGGPGGYPAAIWTPTQVARETKDLIGRARAGRLATEDLTGGTFTVSNLGMYGTDRFTAPS